MKLADIWKVIKHLKNWSHKPNFLLKARYKGRMDVLSFSASIIHLEKWTHTNLPKPEKVARMADRDWQEEKKYIYTNDE